MVAMFSKEEMESHGGESGGNTAETVIGPTVKVEGSFESDDNILIDGQVVGTIKTTKDLTIGEDARIEADVTAANMFISGEIIGNLHVSGTTQLSSSAKITGDIDTQVISIDTGAVIHGRFSSGHGMEEAEAEFETGPAPETEEKEEASEKAPAEKQGAEGDK